MANERAIRDESRQNAFGFLRLLFAVLVLYSHAWFLAGVANEPISTVLLHGVEFPGGLGVKGFFLLSGFLVMRSERRLDGTRAFLWFRGLRIYPGLWFCLMVTGLGFPLLKQMVRPVAWIDWSDAWGYVVRNGVFPRTQINIRGLLTDVPYGGDLNGALWTLPYEIGCYVMLAFAGWVGLTRGLGRGAWLLGGGLLALYVHDLLQPAAALFFKSDGRNLSAWFVVGTLAALLPDSSLRRWLTPVTVAMLAVVTAASLWFGGYRLIGPVALAGIVLWLSWALPFRAFEMRLGGDYSYGLYIYGFPVTQMLVEFGGAKLGIGGLFALSVIVTTAFALLSWHLVEKHALRLKNLLASATSKQPAA